MKTDLLDYLLSTAVLALLAGISFGLAALASSMVTKPALGAYHVAADILLFLLAFGLASAAFCRFLIMLNLQEPGCYHMDHPLFRWWKLFTVVFEFGRGALLPFTTVFAKPLVAKLFGARIGRDIALGGRLVDPQFITIGDEAIIGQDSVITAHTITSGMLILDPVVIGARATVGVNVVVMSGVRIGEGAIVAAGAVVPPKTIVPPGELWGGIPARKLKDTETAATPG